MHDGKIPVTAGALGSGELGAQLIIDTPSRAPSHRTTLVGRDLEVLTLSALLGRETHRLITLTGPGGVGKSRLACAAVADAPIDRIAYLDLHETVGGDGLAETLAARLPDEPSLLVLDGFEQAADATAAAVDTLLSRFPLLRVLTTSRRPLSLYGERLFPVLPLPTPSPPYRQDVPGLQDHAAVELFVDRARAVDPSFALTAQNAQAVAEICTRMDGLPLAIELVAEKLRLFPVDSLLTRLREGRPVLGGDHAARSPLHRSVRTITEHSFRLLDEEQRALISRLSVFTGSVNLTTVEEFSDLPAHRTEQVVEALVGHHLLRVTPGGGELRLTMFNTVREFCLERLAATGGLPEARRRHAEHFLALALEAEEQLTGPQQAQWLRRLAPLHEDLLAALTHLEASGRRTDAARAALALHRFWLVRGHLALGEQWLAKASIAFLSDPGQGGLAARAEAARGQLALAGGNARLAADCFRHAARAFHEAGDTVHEQAALARLAVSRRPAVPSAVRRAAVQLLDAAAGEGATVEAATAALALATGSRLIDAKLSADLLETANALFVRARDVRGEGLVLGLRGVLADSRGDQALAERLLWESLHRLRAIGEHTMLPTVLEGHALHVWRRLPQQGHRVARLLAAASALREATGARPLLVAVDETALRDARRLLSGPEHEAARREGRVLSADAAADEALAVGPPTPEPASAISRPVQLTARQYEVAMLVSQGLTNRQISQQLRLSEWTVVNHVRQVMRRLDVPSRIHIAQWVMTRQRRNGLGPAPE
ncbi:LuxR family transcriptional regulator [Streptomyces roseirectus]|uniref:LuxR family transcriptional regulator n=1 Tax=Streptomyces roseirectus TaxID=2768066 RepID=A0A7H0I979_9ACTN|nr:LuxR C-terminal-related transcriptional regulator [Streptomyces roseirectus]QNP69345.1 LuxR family transcriptional regulator [Streptomyces roseirectus]